MAAVPPIAVVALRWSSLLPQSLPAPSLAARACLRKKLERNPSFAKEIESVTRPSYQGRRWASGLWAIVDDPDIVTLQKTRELLDGENRSVAASIGARGGQTMAQNLEESA
jgi:hypothetical protein